MWHPQRRGGKKKPGKKGKGETSDGYKSESPGKDGEGLDPMGFKVQDLDKTLAELKGKGVTLNTAPGVTAAGAKYAFINGPEGIRIELIERR